MKLGLSAALLSCLAAAVPGFVSAALIPNADTPVFYLVAADPYTENDTFLPLRLYGNNGQATLTGYGPIAKLYYINNTLVGEDPIGADSPNLFHPYVDFKGDDGACGAPSGPFMFIQDSNRSSASNCAAWGTFFLFSDRMDAQLGAKLQLNNNLTSFYSCGKNRDIYYKQDVSDAPVDCTVPVQLYTLPVV
ncbi:hypothetical protein FA15DRAFT_708603 [Coprinopsis marcescibilis]|uniref:Cell wall protein PhiA n=1 Tax=Coprinopsis marcescibilis TaxID=230819 RepID=A0A5C3KII7_COPMA|nr:hypothetical protein FA15DRAFT_708603 [Coprinopsis marcescibilis]